MLYGSFDDFGNETSKQRGCFRVNRIEFMASMCKNQALDKCIWIDVHYLFTVLEVV